MNIVTTPFGTKQRTGLKDPSTKKAPNQNVVDLNIQISAFQQVARNTCKTQDATLDERRLFFQGGR
jgi:hypothetical protein